MGRQGNSQHICVFTRPVYPSGSETRKRQRYSPSSAGTKHERQDCIVCLKDAGTISQMSGGVCVT